MDTKWVSDREDFTAQVSKLQQREDKLDTKAVVHIEEGFQATKAWVKVKALKLDLSPMDLFKVVNGQIIEERVGGAKEPIFESGRNESTLVPLLIKRFLSSR